MLHSGKMGVDYLARKFTIPFLTTHRFLAVVTKDFRASGLGQVRRLNAATATITLTCLFVEMHCKYIRPDYDGTLAIHSRFIVLISS